LAIAQLALNHIAEQIRVTLCETYAAAMGIHSTHGLLPDLQPSSPQPSESTPSTQEDGNGDETSKSKPKAKVSAFRMSNYTPLENCAELYGVDFMVDETFKVSLLEFNAGPDFGQTGQRLKEKAIRPLIQGMTSVILQKIFPSLASLDSQNDAPQIQEEDDYVPLSLNGSGVQVQDMPSAPHFLPVYHVSL